MQECRDIFGKIEISAGMWNTYQVSNPKINIFRAKIRFFFGLKKKM